MAKYKTLRIRLWTNYYGAKKDLARRIESWKTKAKFHDSFEIFGRCSEEHHNKCVQAGKCLDDGDPADQSAKMLKRCNPTAVTIDQY